MSNYLLNKTIAIAGAGPGGLTLARLLQTKGLNVVVYERDAHKDARPKGATLDLHEESGLKALQQAGLMDAFKANYRPGADKLRLVNKHAVIVFDDAAQEQQGESRPEIDRGPLQQILLDSLQPSTVIWDSQLVNLEQKDNGWLLVFKNGNTATADIVIAADGANSKLRRFVTPIVPFYSGITIVEGAVYDTATTVPAIYAMLNGGKIFALDDEKSLIVSSKGDGSLVFYTGCKTSESWVKDAGIDFSDKTAVLNWFKQTFTGWDQLWQQLFEHASGRFIPRPQYCMPADQSWSPNLSITLLGDAAHLMPPYAGEGVNMAMQDALELSECLLSDQYTNTLDAIAAYEKQMLKRSAAVATDTMQATAALHSVNGMQWMMQLFQQ